MTEKQKIKIDVERDNIEYYNFNNYWLGDFYLKTNEFDYSYYGVFNNLMKHFENIDEMYEFSKPFLEKIIGRKFFIKN